MTLLPLLTLLTATPVAGALLAFAAGGRWARSVAGVASVLALLETGALAAGFDRTSAKLQFVERHAWIPSLGTEYFLGVDGLGILLVVLTALLVPLSLAVAPREAKGSAAYPGLVLLLQSGLFGAFTALNFLHWFIYWELSLIPAYFLIKLWGGGGRRAAATQFFIYTFVGSVAMLLAMQLVYLATGSLDLPRLAELGRSGELAREIETKVGWAGRPPGGLTTLAFFGVFLGLAVKVPVMPFHTWLPGAYAEAPSAVTILLTGAMSKMGAYGFLRILVPLFPAQTRQWLGALMALAVITIVASSLTAWAQKDIKRLLAYSSVNHLGLCLLGTFAAMAPAADTGLASAREAALNGVVLQMFNHGLGAGALFACMAILERRSGEVRGIDDFGGLRTAAPVFAGLTGVAIFASLGLPGLNGFVGEFLIFRGAFALTPVAAAIATLGLLFTAVFLLTLIQKVFTGPLNSRWMAFADLTTRERLTLAPAIVLMFLLGVAPQLAAGFVDSTMVQLAANLAP